MPCIESSALQNLGRTENYVRKIIFCPKDSYIIMIIRIIKENFNPIAWFRGPANNVGTWMGWLKGAPKQ